MKLKTCLLTALLAGVYVLHQDFWNWKEAYPLVFGFLPIYSTPVVANGILYISSNTHLFAFQTAAKPVAHLNQPSS